MATADWFAIGVGLASAAEVAEVAALVDETLRTAGIPRDRVRVVATVDSRASHPALTSLEWPIVAYSPPTLAAATTITTATADLQTRSSDSATTLASAASPGPAAAADPTTGTGRPPVAEPAALLAAGPGARLVVPKRRSARATVAVAAAQIKAFLPPKLVS